LTNEVKYSIILGMEVQPIKYIIPKLDKFKIPTPEEMSNFAAKYDKEEWKKLTYDRRFLNIFTINLDEAKKEADKILEVK